MTHHNSTTLKAWRRIAVVGGLLAALAVAGGTAAQAFASQGTQGSTGSGAPATGSPLATQLEAALRSVSTGTVSGVTSETIHGDVGQSDLPEAHLSLAPTAGGPAGNVSVVSFADHGSQAAFQQCDPEEGTCQNSTLPDGSLVHTTDLRDGGEERISVQRQVNGQDVLLVAWSPISDSTGKPAGTDAPLTVDQLVQVASKIAPANQ